MPVSKIFGRKLRRISKEEFEDELLDSDFNNVTKALLMGDVDEKAEEEARELRMDRLLAEQQKIIYTQA